MRNLLTATLLLAFILPAETVRARLLGLPLSRDHEAEWRFGGE